MKNPKCVYCGSENHEMAHRGVWDEGRVFLCIDQNACLNRIRAKVKEQGEMIKANLNRKEVESV